jgi:hypothetical protein
LEKVIYDESLIKGVTKATGSNNSKLMYTIPFTEQHKIGQFLERLELKFPDYLLAIEMASLEQAYIRIVEHYGT